MSESNRREFLATGTAALAAAAIAGVASAQESKPAKRPSAMPAAAGMGAVITQAIPGAIDANGKWTLPPLPYAYDALEPHIDAQTMQIHHDKHHAGYVKGLIACEEKLAEARTTGDFSLVEHWSKKLSFNGGGHFLHCIFWDSMGPNGGGDPTGALARKIAADFGSVAAFKAQFSAAAKAVEGSGWGILGYQVAGAKLTVLQGQNQNLLSQWGVVPLLAIDVWEHAYYLKYQNRRADYVDAWWNVVNWQAVGKRFEMLEH
ncbi:MAG: superoxide dismutase, Fe-Mn family [Candidatus Sumerlaeota bacterium]|nr:superoxide dismutase, Fe-Mn family [Candidatus Sumerlaeota bacterium]